MEGPGIGVRQRRGGISKRSRRSLVACLLAFAPASLAFGAEQIVERPLTLLLTSGLGGQLADVEGRTVASVAGTIRAEAARARGEGREVVVLDLGRTVTPFAESRWDGGETMLAALQEAGCRAWAPDPMDLSLGPEALRRLAAGAGVPVLLPSGAVGEDGAPGLEEEVTIELGGGLEVRVRSVYAPDHRVDLRAAGLRAETGQLADPGSRDGIDVVVVHSDGVGRETPSRRLTWQLMDDPRGADLLLDPDMGHEFLARSRTEEGPVHLVGRDREASPWTVARIDARAVRRPGAGWELEDLATSVLPVEISAPADPRLALRARTTLLRFRRENGAPLGEGAPRTLSELRRFALQAMREATRAEVAVLNRGALRPVADRYFVEGRPTAEAVLRMLSIDQRLEVVELSGSELTALAEQSARRVRRDGAPRSDALEFLGLEVELSAAGTPEAAVESAEVNGRAVDPGDLYRVVTNRYLLTGGDGYEILAGKDGEQGEGNDLELRRDVVIPRLERAAVPFADLGRRSLWHYGVRRLGLAASGVETARDDAWEESTDSRARAADSTHVSAQLKLYGTLDRSRWRWENLLEARFGLVEVEGVTEEVDDDLRLDSSLVLPKARVLGGSPYASVLVDTELRHDASSGASRQLEQSLSAGVTWATRLWPRLRLGLVGRHYSGIERDAQFGLLGQARFHLPPAGRRPGLEAELLAERLEVDDSRVERLDLQLQLLFPLIENLAFVPALDLYLLEDSEFPGSARYTRLSLGLSYVWGEKTQRWGPRPGLSSE